MTSSYLGFDFGLRRIGVAAGQSATASASPVATVAARDGVPDWAAVDRAVAEWRPDAFVVGVPIHVDGTEQELTRRARRFARALGQRYGVSVHEADERLSSAAAKEVAAAARRSGARRRTRKGDLDRMAATVILEQWLRRDHGD